MNSEAIEKKIDEWKQGSGNWEIAEAIELIRSLERERNEARAKLERLQTIINTPETDDFLKALPLEATHQIERWGEQHDVNKTPWDWYWVLGYLGSKCSHAMLAGDITKARHHTITIAALALNWHRTLKEKL